MCINYVQNWSNNMNPTVYLHCYKTNHLSLSFKDSLTSTVFHFMFGFILPVLDELFIKVISHLCGNLCHVWFVKFAELNESFFFWFEPVIFFFWLHTFYRELQSLASVTDMRNMFFYIFSLWVRNVKSQLKHTHSLNVFVNICPNKCAKHIANKSNPIYKDF